MERKDFLTKPANPGKEFPLNLHDIIMEKVKSFFYPVCFDFPVGHVYLYYALKSGVSIKPEVNPSLADLT